jgi:hypothetical protein
VYYLNKTRWLDLGITDDAAGTQVAERSLSQRRGEKAGTSARQSPIRSLLVAPSVSLRPSEEDEDEKEKRMVVQPIAKKIDGKAFHSPTSAMQ